MNLEEKKIEDFDSGDQIRIKLSDGQHLSGLVISKSGKEEKTKFQLLSKIEGVEVEFSFLLISPSIAEIKVLSRTEKTLLNRRAKLYFKEPK